MKKNLVTLLSFIMITSISLIACGFGGTKNISVNGDSKISEKRVAKNPGKLPERAKNRKDTLIVGTSAPLGQFNPIYSSTTYDSWVTSLIFDGMLGNDKSGKPTINLAEKWDISEDEKTYTFHLKKGVKFTNGDELTSKDVEFTYTAVCDPSYDGSRSYIVDSIEGYEEYKKGNATSVKGIKVIDDYTISFTTKEVYAPVIYSFSLGIMPKGEYDFLKGNIQKVKDKFLTPVGSGAYKFIDYKQGQQVDMVRNENFWKGKPKIENIIMKVTSPSTNIKELVAGNVDIDKISTKPENIQQLESAGFLGAQIYPQNGYGYIGWNLKNRKFEDKRVRQALTYGFNRRKFIDLYFKGYAELANGPIMPVSWAYAEGLNHYTYDSDKAAKLLDEAGWKIGSDGIREKDGEKLKINWLTYTGSRYVETLMPMVKEDWKKIGVEIVSESMEFSTLASQVREKRQFEMFNMAWGLQIDPDYSGILGMAEDKVGGFNSVGWKNQDAQKLLNQGIKVTDYEKRKEIYRKWQEIANEELPYMFLDNSKEMFAVSSKVKNLDISTFEDWTMNIYKLELEK